ncbi:S41 family peptidase [Thermoflavimicrobium dichotomicum]|uniref:Carboxyl-terminal processing protease n=1 Tax=Thermoflavimicrobium dichotomicum TaxID=46223 RepID=A0A1I3JV40_9BACL|nr:S41 family peptidase [Thermoflavimicrobium dichotomicum]SFI64026.1 carboxyl-terminal processing protease [Thermoflavimicrobium dichotomicum]
MTFRTRTVAIIVAIAVLLSSAVTALVLKFDELLLAITQPGFSIGSDSKGMDEQINKFKQAYGLIKGNYIRPITDQQLIDGAIKGMVQSLGDPHSDYMDPKDANEFKTGLSSSFSGIGVEITVKNGRLTIVSPIKGSPAEKAGLKPEDQIIKVNGQNIEGMDYREAINKIRGPKGTVVHLDIVRPGVQDALKISVVRDEIKQRTVEATMLPDQLGHITITQFAEGTADDFAKELARLEKQGMKGLILDVRSNPGGLLQAVLKMLEHFIPEGKTLMITQDKEGNKQVYKSKGKGTKPYPIVVLIDKGSASASEIMASSLKEAGGYTLIGETSYGKGTVQSAQTFDDGSTLKLTMAKWLTPNGNWIDQHGGTKGVKPDIQVKYPDYWTAIAPRPKESLKLDQNTVEVKNMQIILRALGYHSGRMDGYFDTSTEIALKAFQQTKNLPVTGQLDEKTAIELDKAFLALKKDPKNDLQLQVAIQTLKKKMRE